MTTIVGDAISSWYGLTEVERIGGHGRLIILVAPQTIRSQIVASIVGVAIKLPSDCGQFVPRPLSK
jgi:hypothetical protein